MAYITEIAGAEPAEQNDPTRFTAIYDRRCDGWVLTGCYNCGQGGFIGIPFRTDEELNMYGAGIAADEGEAYVYRHRHGNTGAEVFALLSRRKADGAWSMTCFEEFFVEGWWEAKVPAAVAAAHGVVRAPDAVMVF